MGSGEPLAQAAPPAAGGAAAAVRRGRPRPPPWALLLSAVCLVLLRASAEIAVMEGDTSADMYINGVFVRRYSALPILPMNNMRRQLAFNNSVQVYKTSSNIRAGDVIAVKVRSSRKTVQPVTGFLGDVTNYSGFAGVIAAFSDGTMTTDAWKCTQDHVEPETPDDDYIPWFSTFFKDETWPQAVEQDPNCCPWRDLTRAWLPLNAKWISGPWYGNYSNERLFYCRYRVPVVGEAHPLNLTAAEGGRLPIAETRESKLIFSEAMGCQAEYRLVAGGCLRYFTETRDFNTSRRLCGTTALGGDLARIDNEVQHLWVFDKATVNAQRTLLGLTDQLTENTWIAPYDGAEATFFNWNASEIEPNGKRIENCAAIVYAGGAWGDVRCDNTADFDGFVCRSKACPDFSGTWMTNPEGYAAETLNQTDCSGTWGDRTFTVLANRTTVSTGLEGHIDNFEDYDLLLWDNGVVWYRHAVSPPMTILDLDVSESTAQVILNVSRRAKVSCGVIDARYLLRTPTALELERWGTTALVNPTSPQYVQLGDLTTRTDYEQTTLKTMNVVIIEECQEECLKLYPDCVLMTFFASGSDLATGRNCRLSRVFDDNKTRESSSALFTHLALYELPVRYKMTLPGTLWPGAIYHAYCSTRDPWTNIHSTWKAIADTRVTERSEGALDAGSLNKPRIYILGGYASVTSIVPVAQADREGRIFCAARPADQAMGSNWTAKMVMDQNFFSILVLANASVPVFVNRLTQATLYEVACVSESDGGAVSTEADIQETRRLWSSEGVVNTVSSMFVERVPQDEEKLSIRTIITVDAIGYLWCLVTRTEAAKEFGVPSGRVIRTDGLVMKIEDLRNDANGIFPDLPSNSTHEVYCTAEKNDFSNETDGASMRSPYPIAEILTHEVGEDRIRLFVKVDRGPATVYCRAFRWATLPTGRRPTTPLLPSGAEPLGKPRTGDGMSFQALMYTSPFVFEVPQPSGGVAEFDLAPVATGSLFDVYCYAEEKLEEVPAGSEPPPRMGMTDEAIRKTLITVQTLGPFYEQSGWHCVSGRECNITGLRGDGLSEDDRVLVRKDACPGMCSCNGKEDGMRKGPMCSNVSQDLGVSAPFPGQLPDRFDPNGEWCYVDPGACADGRPSVHFPNLTLSYAVCAYNLPVLRDGAGPEGFPNHGLATPTPPVEAIVFTMTFHDLDYPRLEHFPAYLGAFEVAIKNAFLIAIGTRFQRKDISFDYLMSQNYAEVFAFVSIAIPDGVVAADAESALRVAIGDWMIDDIMRRLHTVKQIEKTFLGVGNTVNLVGITDLRIDLSPTLGTAFRWSAEPLVAPGYPYHLCHCNGTAGSCTQESDFRLAIGRLHVSGPTKSQAEAVRTCIGGLPCVIDNLDHYAAANGSRLAVVPETSRGCAWTPRSIGEHPGVPGFPLLGTSDPAISSGDVYIWGDKPLVVASGFYTLCWCGPPVAWTRPYRELDVPYAQGGYLDGCAPVRPYSGHGFAAPAGRLRVTGPAYVPLSKCSIGLECVVSGVVGEGITGGDRLTILRTCGQELPEADRLQWTTLSPGMQAMTTTVTTTQGFGNPMAGADDLRKWIEPGWLDNGPPMSPEIRDSIGIGGDSGRGLWGLPNDGFSLSNAREGFYSWGGPLWALAGDYQLCWCAAGSAVNTLSLALSGTVSGGGGYCSKPEHYQVPLGTIRITGPAVLPGSSQVFQCVRRRGCEIKDFEGTMPEGSRLLIAKADCGGAAYPGAPNRGQSFPSADGHSFSWGPSATTLAPGLYKLCWCANIVVCSEPKHFGAYSGLLRIKAPLSDSPLRYCPLGLECNITGVFGQGLHNGDRIAALTVCGAGAFTTAFENQGISIATYGLGAVYTLPKSLANGKYRICWCPGEHVCIRGDDFDTDLGVLIVGGPHPSAVYLCFEWQPCTIQAMEGNVLRDGDMLRLVPPGTSCPESADSDEGPELVPGFPLSGVALPAFNGGYSYTWGEGIVRAEPGTYTLCYCSFEMSGGCTNHSDFLTPAGSLRVGTSQEFQFNTRPEDNPPRSSDRLYAVVLASFVPVLLAVAMGIGWYRRRGGIVKVAPEAPSLFVAKPSFITIAQGKAKAMHEVEQVMHVRMSAPGEYGAMSTKRKNFEVTQELPVAMDMPDFRSDRQKRKSEIATSPDGDAESDDEAEGSGGVAARGGASWRHQTSPDSSLPESIEDDTAPKEGRRERRRAKKERKNLRQAAEAADRVLPPPRPQFTNFRRCEAVMELLDADD